MSLSILDSAAVCALLQLSLCGQTPHTIMESALAGIKFFCEQQKLNAQFDHNQLSKKFTRMQSQCKAKLEQVHQGYLQVRQVCLSENVYLLQLPAHEGAAFEATVLQAADGLRRKAW